MAGCSCCCEGVTVEVVLVLVFVSAVIGGSVMEGSEDEEAPFLLMCGLLLCLEMGAGAGSTELLAAEESIGEL